VTVQFETQTVASITYQNFFKLYNKLAGMTGTAATEAAEFAQIYDLEVFRFPPTSPHPRGPGRPHLRDRRREVQLRRERDRRVAQVGPPRIVGTVSIEKSEKVSAMLEEARHQDFQVLNAKYSTKRSRIVANAGKRGAITIATNMAGRGTDIKLATASANSGGFAIVGTERHESRRIDNQLRGRAGRQGDPGTTRFYLSLEDEVARLFRRR
jgi:preprotein translocase subunit SecA